MESEEMSPDILKEELKQIEIALLSGITGSQKDELLTLKTNIIELLSLSQHEENGSDSDKSPEKNTGNCSSIDNEYALFMAEMEKEGALSTEDTPEGSSNITEMNPDISEELKSLEGMKCRAPHKHNWGDIVYHNAMISSVVTKDVGNYDDIEVKVLFINPTHQEMLPCPYLIEADCKFSDEMCRYSHGEVVPFSDLQEYVEPKFESLSSGNSVLAKSSDNLWYRAVIKKVYNGKCLVKFENNQKMSEVEFEHLFPMETSDMGDDEDVVGDSSDGEMCVSREDVINMSLLNSEVSSQALGNWEKHTKGIGSKLMEKMGYIVGSGLGRNSDGRVEPVTAVILPAGKSLDHCMNLREKAGGDKNLFSAERKLKRLQRRQEIQSKKAYEREKKKVDVFNFLNETLSQEGSSRVSELSESTHRQEIRKESCRSLNVASLKTDEDIRKVERDLFRIKESLTRHADVNSQMHKSLQNQLSARENELQRLQARAVNIKNEQSVRSGKKKLTIF